ncbi:alginate lyase family protein [Qipengyuania sp. DGS5-3]|uniref:alginate lyase family protein n=1 Tax=Qipengyuania sp. DGS5-3 TaxID=3349632 RepID=UPI0036D3E3C2
MRGLIALAGAASLVAAGSTAAASVPAFEYPADGPICRGSEGYAADFGGRRTFLWRPVWLEAIAKDDAHSRSVVRQADEALVRGPYSVADKPKLVPGASRNDYASIGPYWWPNPNSDDGLPYGRRDGEVNPERDGPEFDKDRLRNLANDLEALSVAYFITSDEKYADRAAKLLRVWFLDADTMMAPHMDFAQGIPGKVKGRGEGIIEASDLSTIAESIGLLAPSPALSKREHASLRQWYADFATWMATSDNGEAEMRKSNNHGVFYDFYLAHFAIFAGLDSVALNIADNFLRFRLGVQMDKQGRFIRELKRTRSWHYSNYVVGGAARLATIAECTGRDLWNAELEDGRSLQTSIAFLRRYSRDPQSWPFEDRDHRAGNFDKMRSTFDRVDLLFAGAKAPSSGRITLP